MTVLLLYALPGPVWKPDFHFGPQNTKYTCGLCMTAPPWKIRLLYVFWSGSPGAPGTSARCTPTGHRIDFADSVQPASERCAGAGDAASAFAASPIRAA